MESKWRLEKDLEMYYINVWNAENSVHNYFAILHFRLDLFNNVEGISFSAVQRSSFINAPVDLIYRSYEAFYLLQRTLHHPDNMMQFKMVPGDIVCFNNRRVLHGRTAYDPNTRRWLQGCYFDWDEILCKYRTVKRRLGIKPNFS